MLNNDQIAIKITNMMWGNSRNDSQEFAVQLFMEHLLIDDPQESWTREEMYQLIKRKLVERDKVKGSIFDNAAV